MHTARNIDIVHVRAVLADRVLEDSRVRIEDGMIVRIDGTAASPAWRTETIDARGAVLMPGMVDIHSDQIEQFAKPRPGSMMDIAFALHEQEKQLVNQGITTMFHSLSMRKGPGRKTPQDPDRFADFVSAVIQASSQTRLIHHRLHLRFDVCNPEAAGQLASMIEAGGVSLVSFMDHTPGQGQYRDIARFRRMISPDMGEKEFADMIRERMDSPRVSDEALEGLAALARSKGIPVSSHDDDSREKVDFVRTRLFAATSEFPIDLDTARYARSKGMGTLAGAPNVLTGASHSGNMSALEGILDGAVSMLCSDYYPASMLQAVFTLHRDHGLALTDAVNLVTKAPAEAAGLGGRIGSIEEGKAADLLIVDDSGPIARVVTAVTDGRVASTLCYAPAEMVS